MNLAPATPLPPRIRHAIILPGRGLDTPEAHRAVALVSRRSIHPATWCQWSVAFFDGGGRVVDANAAGPLARFSTTSSGV